MLDRAVINAGPLVALSLAGRLDLLPTLFKEFWIPETVFREVAVTGPSGAPARRHWPMRHGLTGCAPPPNPIPF